MKDTSSRDQKLWELQSLRVHNRRSRAASSNFRWTLFVKVSCRISSNKYQVWFRTFEEITQTFLRTNHLKEQQFFYFLATTTTNSLAFVWASMPPWPRGILWYIIILIGRNRILINIRDWIGGKKVPRMAQWTWDRRRRWWRLINWMILRSNLGVWSLIIYSRHHLDCWWRG